MIRTLKFALQQDPSNSRAIGYCATQQNAAYNVAVDMLNREPHLPKRSGRNHPGAMNKRITAWRQANRQKADAPYHIHQEGAEQAWEANQRMQQSRAERLERIAAAEANGEEPKHRDVRSHRRHYCLHVQVAVPEPIPLETLDIREPEDILGADRGTKNHLAVSSGHRAHHQGGKNRRNRKRKHQRHIAGKPRNSKRRHHAVAKDRERTRRYAQRRDQETRRQIRDILREAQPKMVDVESLKCINLQASARGTVAAPGKNVAAKRKLNESLAESAIGHIGKLLREEAAKLGIPTVSVPPHGTSQTCPRCGDRHPSNRESQAVFQCRNGGLCAQADWTAAVIIRNRAYVRHCEWQHGHTPDVLTAPTGWREQPSGSETQQPKLGLGLSVFKPESTATIRHGGRVRGPRPDRRIRSGGPRRPN